MSSSSRFPTRSRTREPDVEGQHRTSASLKPSSLGSTSISGTGSSSSRYQTSSTTASSSTASTIRRQSLFGTDDRVVLDIGSRVTKVGFSGESRPRDIFWSVEGFEPSSSYDVALWTTDLCRCTNEHERTLMGAKLKARLTRLLRNVFYQRLMIDPKQRKVIIAENALLPDLVKRTMCEVLFGNLQVPSVCFVPSHLLATLAIGRTTSIVIDVGFQESTLLPIYHGRGLTPTHLLTSPRAGKRLTMRLRALLLHYGVFVPHPSSAVFQSGTATSSTLHRSKIPADLLTWEFLEEIKAKALVVGDVPESDGKSDEGSLQTRQDVQPDWTSRTPFSDHDEAEDNILMQVLESRYKQSSRAKDMTLLVPPTLREAVTPATQPSTLGAPSVPATTGRGSIVIPGWIRERAAEVLFEGEDEDELSLIDMILKTLIKLPIDLRALLASDIYVSGGTAMLPGLAHRIRKEVVKRLAEAHNDDEGGRGPEMIALSLPRVGPARDISSKQHFAERGANDTTEERGETLSTFGHHLTMESNAMKQKRVKKERFHCRSISSLASSVAVLNDHAPMIDTNGLPLGGVAPSFSASLSTWIGGSLMGSLRIGVINELSRDVWDEEQEEIDAVKARSKPAERRPGMAAGKGSFLGTVSGLDVGSYGALSAGARGAFSSGTPKSPSAA